jgi:C4-dicarboxylate-specific signal transduction histidine kinase
MKSIVSGQQTTSLRYWALAAALVAVALALTLTLQSILSTAGYLFFYIAVVVSAWIGGKWPGWFAVALSILTVEYFFIGPAWSFGIDRESFPVFVEFAASAAVVSWFSSWRKQAETELQKARDDLQTRVEERTAELRQTNDRLVEEMAERRRAEDAYHDARTELARVTRISALGALAASISHEVNQPLAAVVTNADACMIWLSGDPPNLAEARAAVDAIAREGTRASEVVRHIRAMFAKSTPERAKVQVDDLIRRVASLMQSEASRYSVEIRLDLAHGLPLVWGDSIQLQQVMMNTILNGIEAMTDVADRQRTIVVRSESKDRGHVLVSVRDCGTGISEKEEKRLFDAFFTTKAKGMGMGLSISQSIIEAHGGRLWANNNSDCGATFQFTLPAAPGEDS